MSNRPEQTVSELGSADRERLAEQRSVVEKFVASDLRKLATATGKLAAIRSILDAEVFEVDQTYKLQCLGIVLGDAFVVELGLEWVMVEDEYGRDPAVRLPGTTTLLFPMTMIAKRIERGEAVDVFDLFNGIVAKIEELEQDDG